ncbi:MAG: aspartate ammonia-lyase [Erysipelotrichaceae bacterium]
MKEYRIEMDSLGEVTIEQDKLYGAQTQRAIDNFAISGLRTNTYLIRALGIVKKACAQVNHECGYLDKERYSYIRKACHDVIKGNMNKYFVTDVIQGGAGTSINMNANEVIANRAAQLAGREIGKYDFIHPNDHVNFGQSTNDVFPTANKLAALILMDELLYELGLLIEELDNKTLEFEHIIKMGRTHLQDAVPIKLGQEFGAFAECLRRDMERIKQSFDGLRYVNMGATAVGTGLNTDERYIEQIVPTLNTITDQRLVLSANLVDSTRNLDTVVWASASLKTLAVNLSKMCNDLRLMASGPKTGFAEITLPSRQPGSSIMPGKVNPVILEVVNQISFQVFGNDLTITKAAEAGQLELNVFEPVMFFNLFQSLEILKNGCATLRANAIMGIQANADNCREYVEKSVGIVTALAPHIGYEKASYFAKKSLAEKRNVREIIEEANVLSKVELDEILNIHSMTSPGIKGKGRLHKDDC